MCVCVFVCVLVGQCACVLVGQCVCVFCGEIWCVSRPEASEDMGFHFHKHAELCVGVRECKVITCYSNF